MAKKKSKRRMLSQSKKPIQGLAQRIRFRGTFKCRKVGAANWGNSKKAAEGGVVSAIDNPKRPPRRNLKDGGFIAGWLWPCYARKERQVTRIF